MRDNRTVIKALRNGKILSLGKHVKFRMDVDENGKEKDIREGDLYIAERNTGPRLLTAKMVIRLPQETSCYGGYIIATTEEYEYPYGISECVKVVEVEEEEEEELYYSDYEEEE